MSCGTASAKRLDGIAQGVKVFVLRKQFNRLVHRVEGFLLAAQLLERPRFARPRHD